MSDYDSRADTLEHIGKVSKNLMLVVKDLIQRSYLHDLSKLEDPEKAAFDKMTPLLRSLEYGSDEYKKSLDELGVALDHHYKNNSHHPEHYHNGIDGMSLCDLVEMLCDWKAATERTANGDLEKSIEINAERFGITDQLKAILRSEALDRGWIGM